MRKDLVAAPDSLVAVETSQLLCAIKFLSNRKRNFESVLALARSSDLFMDRDGQYLVGFSKTKKSAKLAMAVLEEMRMASWDYVLFANGQVQIKKNALRNVLDCYNTASTLRDPTKHCHKVFDEPKMHFMISTKTSFGMSLDDETSESPVSWRLPCVMLEGFIAVREAEMNEPHGVIEAAAAKRLTACCPLFNINAFEIIEKAPLVAKPKRYW